MKLEPCPFCGHTPDPANSDTLYPNGTAWIRDDHGFKLYFSTRTAPKYSTMCYVLNCCECCGGCGAEINADSIEEAVEKWNRRIGPLDYVNRHS